MKSFDLGKSMVLGAAAASLLAPRLASAGGLYAGDPGSQAQSRAGAFVAKADDPTALMHNPAGLVKARHFDFFLGANLVHFSQTFDREGVYQERAADGSTPGDPAFAGQEMPEIKNDGPIQPIPFLAAVQRFGNFAIGEGVFAPQGYPNRNYPETVDVNGMSAPAPQRYDMVKQESIAALPSIAAAYRVTDQLDLGARASWGFGTLNARTYLFGLPNQTEDVGTDAVFDIDVKDNFVPAFGFGVLFRPTGSIELGAAYSSEIVLDMKGSGTPKLGPNVAFGDTPVIVSPLPDDQVKCDKGGTSESLKACLKLVIPMTATVGARYVLREHGAERGDIELDVRWENWKAAEDIVVTVDAQVENIQRPLEVTILHHGFQDVISTRLGGSYGFPNSLGNLIVRAGVSYDTAAAPTSWTRPDIDGTERLQFAGGVALETKSWRIDLGGSGIFSAKRTVTGDDPFQPQPAMPTPQDSRTHPDPSNPQLGPKNQDLHPFNLGTYSSGYIIIATGVTFML